MAHRQSHNFPHSILAGLFQSAGLSSAPQSIELLGVSTAEVWALTTAQGDYVLRYQPDGAMAAVHKEQYLSNLLAQHDLPASRVLATLATEQGSATLSTRLAGARLDQVLPTLGPPEQEAVWRSVGAVLRQIHGIALPIAGEIVGDRIESFPIPWAAWVLDDLPGDLYWLQQQLGFMMPDTHELAELVQLGQHWLANRPIRLIHNDALPQNILVAHSQNGWYCSGWLDWEFCRAGDPLWDLATLDFRPAGLVPTAFYSGYGERPAALHGLYDLLMATWRTRAVLEHGASWEWPPPAAWRDYLATIQLHMHTLLGALRAKDDDGTT